MENSAVRSLSLFAVLVDPEHDSVAVAKQIIPAGERLMGPDGQTITVRAEITPGHRLAIRPVAAGEWVRQYGEPFAISRGLQPGDPVTKETVENMVPQVDPESIPLQPTVLTPWEGPIPTFDGFHRSDGRVGVRNWILIVPTSNCSSHEASMIALQAELSGLYSREKYPNVDGVTAIPHMHGCGCPDRVSAGAPGHHFNSIVEVTLRLLANHIRHPNIGAALIIDLGCEKTNLAEFDRFTSEDLNLKPEPKIPANPAVDLSAAYGKPVFSLSIQSCGGTRATI